MNVGKILNEDPEVYHASGALGSTLVNTFHEDPLLFYMRFVEKTEPFESTRAVDMGQLLHTRILEPNEFDKRFVILPKDHKGTTTAGKALKEEIENYGRTAIKFDDFETMKKMEAGFKRKRTAMELIEGTEREVSWRMKYGKFAVQARTDIWNEKGTRLSYNGEETGIYFADIKKIRSHEYPGFQGAISEYGYHRQTVLYQEVIAGVLSLKPEDPRPRCFHIVVSEAAPFETEIREIDKETLDLARHEIFSDLKALRICFETNVWPGKLDAVVPVGLTHWAKKEAMLRLEEKGLTALNG